MGINWQIGLEVRNRLQANRTPFSPKKSFESPHTPQKAKQGSHKTIQAFLIFRHHFQIQNPYLCICK